MWWIYRVVRWVWTLVAGKACWAGSITPASSAPKQKNLIVLIQTQYDISLSLSYPIIFSISLLLLFLSLSCTFSCKHILGQAKKSETHRSNSENMSNFHGSICARTTSPTLIRCIELSIDLFKALMWNWSSNQ